MVRGQKISYRRKWRDHAGRSAKAYFQQLDSDIRQLLRIAANLAVEVRIVVRIKSTLEYFRIGRAIEKASGRTQCRHAITRSQRIAYHLRFCFHGVPSYPCRFNGNCHRDLDQEVRGGAWRRAAEMRNAVYWACRARRCVIGIGGRPGSTVLRRPNDVPRQGCHAVEDFSLGASNHATP